MGLQKIATSQTKQTEIGIEIVLPEFLPIHADCDLAVAGEAVFEIVR